MHYYRGAERCRWVSYLNSDETEAKSGGLNLCLKAFYMTFRPENRNNRPENNTPYVFPLSPEPDPSRRRSLLSRISEASSLPYFTPPAGDNPPLLDGRGSQSPNHASAPSTPITGRSFSHLTSGEGAAQLDLSESNSSEGGAPVLTSRNLTSFGLTSSGWNFFPKIRQFAVRSTVSFLRNLSIKSTVSQEFLQEKINKLLSLAGEDPKKIEAIQSVIIQMESRVDLLSDFLIESIKPDTLNNWLSPEELEEVKLNFDSDLKIVAESALLNLVGYFIEQSIEENQEINFVNITLKFIDLINNECVTFNSLETIEDLPATKQSLSSLSNRLLILCFPQKSKDLPIRFGSERVYSFLKTTLEEKLLEEAPLLFKLKNNLKIQRLKIREELGQGEQQEFLALYIEKMAKKLSSNIFENLKISEEKKEQDLLLSDVNRIKWIDFYNNEAIKSIFVKLMTPFIMELSTHYIAKIPESDRQSPSNLLMPILNPLSDCIKEGNVVSFAEQIISLFCPGGDLEPIPISLPFGFFEEKALDFWVIFKNEDLLELLLEYNPQFLVTKNNLKTQRRKLEGMFERNLALKIENGAKILSSEIFELLKKLEEEKDPLIKENEKKWMSIDLYNNDRVKSLAIEMTTPLIMELLGHYVANIPESDRQSLTLILTPVVTQIFNGFKNVPLDDNEAYFKQFSLDLIKLFCPNQDLNSIPLTLPFYAFISELKNKDDVTYWEDFKQEITLKLKCYHQDMTSGTRDRALRLQSIFEKTGNDKTEKASQVLGKWVSDFISLKYSKNLDRDLLVQDLLDIEFRNTKEGNELTAYIKNVKETQSSFLSAEVLSLLQFDQGDAPYKSLPVPGVMEDLFFLLFKGLTEKIELFDKKEGSLTTLTTDMINHVTEALRQTKSGNSVDKEPISQVSKTLYLKNFTKKFLALSQIEAKDLPLPLEMQALVFKILSEKLLPNAFDSLFEDILDPHELNLMMCKQLKKIIGKIENPSFSEEKTVRNVGLDKASEKLLTESLELAPKFLKWFIGKWVTGNEISEGIMSELKGESLMKWMTDTLIEDLPKIDSHCPFSEAGLKEEACLLLKQKEETEKELLKLIEKAQKLGLDKALEIPFKLFLKNWNLAVETFFGKKGSIMRTLFTYLGLELLCSILKWALEWALYPFKIILAYSINKYLNPKVKQIPEGIRSLATEDLLHKILDTLESSLSKSSITLSS